MDDRKPQTVAEPAVAAKTWHAPQIEVLPLDHTAASSLAGNDSGGAAITSAS